jgi:hypothetical protein
MRSCHLDKSPELISLPFLVPRQLFLYSRDILLSEVDAHVHLCPVQEDYNTKVVNLFTPQ